MAGRKIIEWARKTNRKLNNPIPTATPVPSRTTPAKSNLKPFTTLEWTWGTREITFCDPMAGGGSIPFEALRYGLTVHANELNPWPASSSRLRSTTRPGSAPRSPTISASMARSGARRSGAAGAVLSRCYQGREHLRLRLGKDGRLPDDRKAGAAVTELVAAERAPIPIAVRAYRRPKTDGAVSRLSVVNSMRRSRSPTKGRSSVALVLAPGPAKRSTATTSRLKPSRSNGRATRTRLASRAMTAGFRFRYRRRTMQACDKAVEEANNAGTMGS